VGFCSDITERKQAEQALRKSRDYAENLIQTANVLVLVLDLNANVKVLNEAGEKLTGYSFEELRGKNWDIVVPRTRCPEIWKEQAKLATEGEIVKNFENCIMTKSGEERCITWQNNEIKESGEVVGSISFGIDITEHKIAEEALRESEEKFRQLAENVNAVFWLSDVDNQKMFYVSPQYEKIWGRSCQSLYDNPASFAEAVYPEDRAVARGLLQMGKEHGTFDSEYRIL